MGARKENENAAAPKSAPGRARRIFFIAFKWFRISVLLFILVVVLLGLFLNRFGLPVAFQQRIVEQARARGWDLEFSRLRLRWYRGLVAENVSLSRTNTSAGPHIFVETAELGPNLEALKQFRFQLDSVRLAGGRVVWPILVTNQPTYAFTLEDVRGELLFHPNDEWELRSLDALLLGARVRIRGNVFNASLLRDWRFPRRPRVEPKPEAVFWNRLARESRRVRFDAAPELTVIFSCDAREPSSMSAMFKLVANAMESPWALAKDIRLTSALTPSPAPDEPLQIDVKLTVSEASGSWGSGSKLEVTAGFESTLTNWVPTNASVSLALRSVATPWANGANVLLKAQINAMFETTEARRTSIEVIADQVRGEAGTLSRFHCTGNLLHLSTNVLPAIFRADLDLGAPQTRWVTSDWAHVNLRAGLPVASNLFLFQTNRAWPERLTNLEFDAVTTITNANAWRLTLDTLRLTNRWQAPVLRTELAARMGQGGLNGVVDLQLPERRLDFKSEGLLPLEKLSALVDTNIQWILAGHKANALPRFQTAGTLTLPAWTNRPPDWHEDLLPALSMSGMLEGSKGSYRGVAYDKVSALFELTNLFFRAPEITILRPEGSIQADLASDTRTGVVRCRVRSTIDPKALDPILHSEAKADPIDLFEFTHPPSVDVVLHGNIESAKLLGFDADIALTNLTFRGQNVSSCTTRVLYTNGLISILRPVVLRPGERGEAAGIGIDLGQRRLFLTNATGNLTPHAVARAIGPITYRDVSPYVFDAPPQARVEGSIPIGRSDLSENMRFDLDGGPFHWRKFTFDRIRGTVFWRSNTVTLTNIQARWCGGDMAGWLFVDFAPTNTDLLSFYSTVREASLREIVRQMNPTRPNRLEGLLSGELNITRADLKNDLSWMGHGYVHLTNGLVWDIPLFGVFSPVLNAFVPGLGHTRARHADATFGITNSVIYSRDLEIRATMMRMQFRGMVDFSEQVEGRMEAELLRDLPAIGFVISKVLWPVTKLFEYRVTGKLANPKTEQVYVVSRILLFPFQPVKTLKDLFGKETNENESLTPSNEAPPPRPP
jgi:hypothetical protein